MAEVAVASGGGPSNSISHGILSQRDAPELSLASSSPPARKDRENEIELSLMRVSEFLSHAQVVSSSELEAILKTLAGDLRIDRTDRFEGLLPDDTSYLSRLFKCSEEGDLPPKLCRELSRALLAKYICSGEQNNFASRDLGEVTRAALEHCAGNNSSKFGLILQIWMSESTIFRAADIDLLFRLALVQSHRGYQPIGDPVAHQRSDERLKLKKGGPEIDLFSLVSLSQSTSDYAHLFLTKHDVPLYKFARAIEIASETLGVERAHVDIDMSNAPDMRWTLAYRVIRTLEFPNIPTA